MNVFKKVKLYFAAKATCKHKLLRGVPFDNELKIAPYVMDTLISCNKDIKELLHNKRFPTYLATRKGRIWRQRCNLAVGMNKTEETIRRLQSEILKEDMFADKELERLQEQRIQGQANKKPHLVQQCNEKEDQFMKAYITRVLNLINTICKVMSTQIEALSEAENQIADRLGECMEQIQRFYAALPGFGCREQLRLPTLQELEMILPLQIFPENYQEYKKELIKLYQKYEKMAEELRKKLGV